MCVFRSCVLVGPRKKAKLFSSTDPGFHILYLCDCPRVWAAASFHAVGKRNVKTFKVSIKWNPKRPKK